MTRDTEQDLDWTMLFWPGLFAAEAGLAFTRTMMAGFRPPPSPPPEPVWATANEIVLELPAARLRRFDRPAAGSAGTPILVCAPFALHDARIADLCEGHSLMARLRGAGRPLYLVEWLSAQKNPDFSRHRRLSCRSCRHGGRNRRSLRLSSACARAVGSASSSRRASRPRRASWPSPPLRSTPRPKTARFRRSPARRRSKPFRN